MSGRCALRSSVPFGPVFLLAGVPLLGALLVPGPGNALEADFNDPARCAACQVKIFEQWEASIHALAAERITRDRRILPKGYEEEKYALPVPPGTAYPPTIEAVLNYRSMSQAFADMFFPDGSVKGPVVRMAEVRRTIPADGPKARPK